MYSEQRVARIRKKRAGQRTRRQTPYARQCVRRSAAAAGGGDGKRKASRRLIAYGRLNEFFRTARANQEQSFSRVAIPNALEKRARINI